MMIGIVWVARFTAAINGVVAPTMALTFIHEEPAASDMRL
jgi:hypothetical protein